MSTKQQLINLAEEIIRAQIDKYTSLTRIGIGPDAQLSAALAYEQADVLISQLKTYQALPSPTPSQHAHFAYMLNFYIECEFMRSHAGWLLDDNKIHNPLYERVISQSKRMADLYKDNPSWHEHFPKELTTSQQQFLHDSHSVAYTILNLVQRLKEDPQRDDIKGASGFGHGLMIMRRHAKEGGRYHQPEIYSEIEHHLKRSSVYLESSSLSKRDLSLSKLEAEERQATQLLALGTITQNPEKKSTCSFGSTLMRVGLFALPVLGIAAGYAIKQYCMDDDTAQCSLPFGY